MKSHDSRDTLTVHFIMKSEGECANLSATVKLYHIYIID